jgi:hypothetical protein
MEEMRRKLSQMDPVGEEELLGRGERERYR